MRSLINLCALQGVSVEEFLAAPRETSGPMLFDAWSGLSYMPLPSPRQAQKIYAASRCLRDFLQVRPAYLPPMSLLLGRLNVQLLAIRDVTEEAYDYYQDAHAIQGDAQTQKTFLAAYLSAMSVTSASAGGASGGLARVAERVAVRTGVPLAVATHAARSAAVVLSVWSGETVKRYELEMPIEAAVAWFVKNRRCPWNGI